jgi:hypothetical protein
MTSSQNWLAALRGFKKPKRRQVLFDPWCMETVASFFDIVDLCTRLRLVCPGWSKMRASWATVTNFSGTGRHLVSYFYVLSSCIATRVESVAWRFGSDSFDSSAIKLFLEKTKASFPQVKKLDLTLYTAYLTMPFPFTPYERLTQLRLCVHVQTPSWFSKLEPDPERCVWPDLPSLEHLSLVGMAGGSCKITARRYFFLHLVVPALRATRALRTIEVMHNMFVDVQTHFESNAARLIEERHADNLDTLALAFDPHGCFPRVRCRVLQLGSSTSSFDSDVRAMSLRAQYASREAWTNSVGLEILENVRAQELILWDCVVWVKDLSMTTATKLRIVDTKQLTVLQLDMSFVNFFKPTLKSVDLGRVLMHRESIWTFSGCSKLEEVWIKLQCDDRTGTFECRCRDTFNQWAYVAAVIEPLRTVIVSSDSRVCIKTFDMSLQIRSRKKNKVQEDRAGNGDLVLRLN